VPPTLLGPDFPSSGLSPIEFLDGVADLQESRNRTVVEPIFASNIYYSLEDSEETVNKTQEADANAPVLTIFAHDADVLGVVDFFPAKANDWYEKDWREKMTWAFLDDFVGLV
jgi:hypothetical protein